MSASSGRPDASEHAPYFGKYVALVDGHDAISALEVSTRETASLLGGIGDERSRRSYAPGKWTLREVFLHLTDVERVFGYRALRVARGDETPLEGFDPDGWMQRAGADARSWDSVVSEVEAVRAATLALYRSLPAEAWARGGTADGSPITVRALAFITAGHEAHHRRIIGEKYL
jgi:hypothetical protein